MAGRYEIHSLLGQGGMGAVYRVTDRELGREVALKVMHPHLMQREKAVERFVREARIALELAHANIVRMRDIGRAGDLRYLTMELLEGRSLRIWLDGLRREKRLAPLNSIHSIIRQVLDALEYAHGHTVHRDIKPENIFLCGDEPDLRVKILDFGIAKALDRETLTSTSTSLGTAWYMAPEQMEDAGEVDGRADLFGAGVVLYEMLTGTVPHGMLALPTEVRPEAGEGVGRTGEVGDEPRSGTPSS